MKKDRERERESERVRERQIDRQTDIEIETQRAKIYAAQVQGGLFYQRN